MRRAGLLVLGHGSRDPEGNRELEAAARAIAAARPAERVGHGYIELAAPLFPEALDALASACDRVVVLPLFLFAAGHVKEDVPRALGAARRRHPAVAFTAARPLGVDPAMVAIASERLTAASPPRLDEQTAVVIVGRGSSDPDANGDLFKLARLLVEARAFATVQACFAGIRRPFLPATLDLVARLEPRRVVVLPYLLFPGRILTRLHEELAGFRARAPGIEAVMAPPLGLHPRLLALVEQRVAAASGLGGALPCDGCGHRGAPATAPRTA